MKKMIKCADEVTVEERLKDDISAIKDDFDYAVSGIEKIAADGDFATASELIAQVKESVNVVIEAIASDIAEGE